MYCIDNYKVLIIMTFNSDYLLTITSQITTNYLKTLIF